MGKRIFLSLLICVLAFSMSALAQETTGGIQGTVKDPQGAVVPGAIVEVSSPALIGKKDYLEGMEAGADDFVTKPFDADELKARLRVAERIISFQEAAAAEEVG